ncbi:MAG: cyanophycinase [Chloroflexota bacterium]|nr:cyanophycinase [Chloroflexota bacterium]
MSQEEEKRGLSAPVASAPSRRISQGPVMPIGGGEEKESSCDEEVFQRFVELAGGKQAAIVVIPTASETPEEMGAEYTRVFSNLGAKSVEVLQVEEREDANSDSCLRLLEGASGIFISGGAQSQLVSLLAGTLSMECIRTRNADGVVVAGTSAGASIVASHMVAGDTGLAGDSGTTAAHKGMVEMVSGFGLVQDLIIDQHFSERGRMGRLLSVLAANPGMLCIGLDEDTAVVIDREGMLEVLGSGMVTIIDGRNTTSDYFERKIGDVLPVVNSHLSVLGSGRRFDLDRR